MQDGNVMYEITQMMRDKKTFQNDMSEIMGMVGTMFQDKYLSRIMNAVQTHQLKTQNEPPREVQLLHAIKLFMPETSHEKMNSIIDTYMTVSTIKNIQAELRMVQEPYGTGNGSGYGYVNPAPPPQPSAYIQPDMEASIHVDGVYDIDDRCVENKKPEGQSMLALMAAMSMLRR